jgi:NTP pyrophosphatase (non-canonical NTP hydrolase)
MMHNYGFTKLVEECAELIVEIAKLQAYPSGEHPDGKGNLYKRIALEMGDVLAAIIFTHETNDLVLDLPVIESQCESKLKLYYARHADPEN